jgi:hypothetical protein
MHRTRPHPGTRRGGHCPCPGSDLVLQPEILRFGDRWDRLVVGPGAQVVREGVTAAAVVTDQGTGLVEAAPELAGQGGFNGVAGVEVGDGQAVPDGVDAGP